nr:argininosuccinate lyase [bacterium]
THLQRAQPITLGHHLMAYYEMFKRDGARFTAAHTSADRMPLGSGALAGTTYPLNRARVAQLLGFTEVTPNSLDGVSDRDFVMDFVYACSMVMVHISRLCEELILWSSQEFGFVQLDDAYATGSSIMPQKKNPDVAELARGKSGRVIGDLMGLLTTMKGLPLAYNKDMQEDKEPLFDAFDTVMKVLGLFPPMLKTARFQTDRMEQAALDGFANATDVADYLVKKGLPFRQAHEVSGHLVRECIHQKCNLADLPLEAYQAQCPLFEGDIYQAISLEACLKGRNLPGGPAPEAVLAHIARARQELAGG